jgi:aldehyde:ferredoxin oxidoreductase
VFGYAGKILRVNLTQKRATEEPLQAHVARKFIGGRGLIGQILFEELKPGIDPFGPENRFVVATGPIVGIPIVGSAKHAVGAKSPLTYGLGHSQVTGSFGAELKSGGYDAIIVEGKAASPVYLWIHNGITEIKDADHLWGKPTRDVQRLIAEEVKDDCVRVGCIGIGGENLVRFACVMFTFNHAAGRTGMGAVMGSKRLKAIAVRGTQAVKYSDEEKLIALAKEDQANRGEHARKGPYWPDSLDKYGSDVDLGYWQLTGRLPTMNFRKCTFSGADKINGEALHDNMVVRNHACPYCPIACNKVVEAHYPYEVDPDYGGPEYETCAALGSMCMNESLVALCKSNELCNKYGLDTISTGVAIAFAMECYEKGLIRREDTEGLDLSWGNPEAMVQLPEKIAKREGIGGLLAEGVKRAAEKIGNGAEEFAVHVKGMEVPMHEGRGKKGHGFVYAVSNRGAHHQDMESDDLFEEQLCPEIGISEALHPRDRLYAGPEKSKLVKIVGDLFNLFDSLPICRWTVFPASRERTLGYLIPIVRAATGWDVSVGELMIVGERVWNIERAFNVREGIARKDDVLPRRMMEEPLPDGPYKGETFSRDMLDKMLDGYYESRGWDKQTGIPKREKLEELGLEYVAKELESLGILKK